MSQSFREVSFQGESIAVQTGTGYGSLMKGGASTLQQDVHMGEAVQGSQGSLSVDLTGREEGCVPPDYEMMSVPDLAKVSE